MIKIKRLVGPGGMFPRFYGEAYFIYETSQSVCYPIPFNFLVGWAYGLLCILKCGPRAFVTYCYRVNQLNKAMTALRLMSRAYDIGQEAGPTSAIAKTREVLNEKT